MVVRRNQQSVIVTTTDGKQLTVRVERVKGKWVHLSFAGNRDDFQVRRGNDGTDNSRPDKETGNVGADLHEAQQPRPVDVKSA